MTGWGVWEAFRGRGHLVLRWGVLAGCRGLIEDLGDGRRRVWLDVRSTRVERRCALAHELIHDERGILYNPSTPPGLIEKEESTVNRETVARLVPIDDLLTFCQARAEYEGIEAWMVAEHFDVTDQIAERALARLRHPTMRTRDA